MSGKTLTYVDSAIYIAWIKSEDRGEGDMIQSILSKEVVAVSSVIVRTEVMEARVPKEKLEVLGRVLSPPRLQLKSVTIRIADLAREIRDHYARLQEKKKDLPLVGMADAIHLATAIHYECPRLVTLDGVKKNGRPSKLLLLNGRVAGKYPLEICEPGQAQKAWSI